MKILAAVKSILTFFGIVPIPEEMLPQQLQQLTPVINFIYPLCMFLSVLCYNLSVFYFLLFEAQTFSEYSECGFHLAVSFSHVVSYIILFQARSKLSALFIDSDGMVKKRSENRVLGLIYITENEKIAKFSKTLFKSGFILVEVFLFPKAALSFYKYFTTDMGEDAFELILLAKVPWNWKTPWGYFASVCTQYILVHSGVLSIFCVMPLIFGFCTIFEAFTSDINVTLADINANVINTDTQFTINKRLDIYKKLTQTATFHSKVKELTKRYSDTYKSLITICFAISSISLCSSLLGLDVAIHVGISEFMRIFVCFAVMLGYLVMFCVLGDDVTISFGQIHESISVCSWYYFPLDTQKLLPLMLASAQKPVYINGHLNIRCTRESCKQIVKAAVSYFGVFREFNNS